MIMDKSKRNNLQNWGIEAEVRERRITGGRNNNSELFQYVGRDTKVTYTHNNQNSKNQR